MAAQYIGRVAQRAAQLKSARTSKGFVVEEVVVAVGCFLLGTALVCGMVKLGSAAIDHYYDYKTSTVYNSEGVVTSKDSSGGYFSPVMVSDGRGGFTTIQQYVPETFYIGISSAALDRPFAVEVYENTYTSTHIGQAVGFHYRVGGKTHKVIDTGYGHVDLSPPKMKM